MRRGYLGVVESLVVEALGAVDIYLYLVQLVALYCKKSIVVVVVVVVEQFLDNSHERGDILVIDKCLYIGGIGQAVADKMRDYIYD